MKPITDELVAAFLGRNAQRWTDALLAAQAFADLTTPARMAAFLGQCYHESAGFKVLRENLNYGADGLAATFPSLMGARDKDGKLVKPAKPNSLALSCARNPEKIANTVYANKYGNGDALSGDGWRYRGGGLIQTTFRSNWTLAQDDTGLPLLANPDLCLQARVAALMGASYWKRNLINAVADTQDWVAVTRKINPALLHHAERERHIKRALALLA